MRKKQYNSEEALQALVQGKEEGLDHFFHLYYAYLTYFSFKLVNDQQLAEEIVTESFIKLWNNREKFVAEVSVKAWLYKTVRNTSIDHLRKVKRLHISDIGLEIIQSNDQTVLHRMIETETIQQIIQLLQLLPPKCSRIFKMFFLEGKSHEEIASELNLSPSTVRVQKARAIRLIKTRLSYLFLLTSSLL